MHCLGRVHRQATSILDFKPHDEPSYAPGYVTVPAYARTAPTPPLYLEALRFPSFTAPPHKGGRSSPARLRHPGHRLRRCLRCLRRQYNLPPAYCAARLLPALSRLTPAYYAARLLCRLIFDLSIDSLLTRYASVTEPA